MSENIHVRFGPDNVIQSIECEAGLTRREIEMLVQKIDQEPLWLQSMADRGANTPTTATTTKEALRERQLGAEE